MRISWLLPVIVICGQLSAQVQFPKSSPRTHLLQEIGLAQLEVDYSRPATRGRSIFGALVPYGRIWRVGANESTKFTTDQELKVGPYTLDAGTYSLYAFPGPKSWEIVFHTNTTHWGDGRSEYDPSEDAFRLNIIPEKTERKQENFLITFDQITNNSAEMIWWWDHTLIRIPFQLPTTRLMEEQIETILNGNPNPQTCYEIARYYQQEGEELQQGLRLVDKALSLGGDTYYFHRVRSLLLADLGRYREAVQAAEKSMILAEKEGKDEFVRMNAANIRRWNPLARSEPRP